MWALPFDPRDVSSFLAYLSTSVSSDGRSRLTAAVARNFLDAVFIDNESKGFSRRRRPGSRNGLLMELGLLPATAPDFELGVLRPALNDDDLRTVLSSMANVSGRGARGAVGCSTLILMARATGLGMRQLLAVRREHIRASDRGLSLVISGSQAVPRHVFTIDRAPIPLVCTPCALSRWFAVSASAISDSEIISAKRRAASDVHQCFDLGVFASAGGKVFDRLGRGHNGGSGSIRVATASQAVHWHLNRAGLQGGPYSLRSVIQGGVCQESCVTASA
ncbi:hypothetical protein C8E83_3008 [Frondihabitans australicus]|uniref:Uncharacterized protein n=1 Tax=Frondihabitans australicus TaxID=386892 RepID=A0A495IIP3_9MICO|nr:hypothetical protein C8E83_3008 [Frondihabitans australicus]